MHRTLLRKANERLEPCSPRLLVLNIDGCELNLTVIVAHAVSADASEECRDCFLDAPAGYSTANSPSVWRCSSTLTGWENPASKQIGGGPGDTKTPNGQRTTSDHGRTAFTPKIPAVLVARLDIEVDAVSGRMVDAARRPTTLPAVRAGMGGLGTDSAVWLILQIREEQQRWILGSWVTHRRRKPSANTWPLARHISSCRFGKTRPTSAQLHPRFSAAVCRALLWDKKMMMSNHRNTEWQRGTDAAARTEDV